MLFFAKTILVIALFMTGRMCWSSELHKSMSVAELPAIAPTTTFFDGKKNVTLQNFDGKFLLVNFWATWCSPCVTEMPSLDRMAKKLAGQNILVLIVNEDEGGGSEVRSFVRKLKLNSLTALYDTNNRAFKDFSLRGLPTTFLISPKGIVLASFEGSAVWDKGELYDQIVENLKKYR